MIESEKKNSIGGISGDPSTSESNQQAGPVFLKVYGNLVTSGLLAELSGNQLKVLLALGLEAHVLGSGAGTRAERHFQRLHHLGVVNGSDRGRLFCYLDRDTIALQTGLSPRTITAAGNGLVERDVIEKRRVRNRNGRHDYTIYFVRSSSQLGKFDFNRRPTTQVEHSAAHRGKNLPMVPSMGKEPPVVGFPYVKKGSSRRRNGWNCLVSSETTKRDGAPGRDGTPGVREPGAGHDQPAGSGAATRLDAEVFAAFARRQGAERYQPTDRDLRGLAQVRAEGCTQHQILSAVDGAFDSRNQDAEPVRRFAYCLPIIRSMGPASGLPCNAVPRQGPTGDPASHASARPAQPPQPVPSGPPVAGASPAATRTAASTHQAAQTVTPAVASPLSGGTREPEGTLTPGAFTSAHADPEWDAAMEQVYGAMRKAGKPVTEALSKALQAKAVRVDEVARQQGAGGPSWVGEAMLVALGRKTQVPQSGRGPSTDEALLAYADGILNNWIRDGRPRLRAAPRPPPFSRQGIEPKSQERPPRDYGTHLLHREPKSEKEVLWEQVLADLRTSTTEAVFDRNLRGSRLHELQRQEEGGARLVVVATTPWVADWLENRMKPAIRRAVEGRLGQEAELTFLPVLDRQS